MKAEMNDQKLDKPWPRLLLSRANGTLGTIPFYDDGSVGFGLDNSPTLTRAHVLAAAPKLLVVAKYHAVFMANSDNEPLFAIFLRTSAARVFFNDADCTRIKKARAKLVDNQLDIEDVPIQLEFEGIALEVGFGETDSTQ